MARSKPLWRPYDPTWLIELAKVQKAHKPWLQRALAECTTAQARTCCAPRVCGYYFVDATHANSSGSAWQFETNLVLEDITDGRFVILDILQGRRVGRHRVHVSSGTP